MNLEDLFKVWDRFEKSDIGRICFENESGKIKLEKPSKVAAEPAVIYKEPSVQSLNQAAPVEAFSKETENDDSLTYVKAPFVGTFYRSPGPDDEPFVSVGQKVKKGDILCIVEAMKIMNEITASMDGTVTAILAEDEELVEYGQNLISIGA